MDPFHKAMSLVKITAYKGGAVAAADILETIYVPIEMGAED